MYQISLNLTGKIALVTEGAYGIGKAIAEKLNSRGATVVVVASVPAPEPTPYHFIDGNLSQGDQAQNIINTIVEQFGRIDILINNIGGTSSPMGGFSVLSEQDWEKDLQHNLLAPVRLDKAVVPGMLERKSGVVIHISSLNSLYPLYASAFTYGVAKAALNSYSKTLAREVTSQGVRVVTVSPGVVATESMNDYLANIARNASINIQEAAQRLMNGLGGVPIGRMAEPSEIANLVAFLVSAEASYISGVNYVVDGATVPTL
jgi:NAD(P)-dependent dehydrogenase (short-subunit alcohol dehydrogenase family)